MLLTVALGGLLSRGPQRGTVPAPAAAPVAPLVWIEAPSSPGTSAAPIKVTRATRSLPPTPRATASEARQDRPSSSRHDAITLPPPEGTDTRLPAPERAAAASPTSRASGAEPLNLGQEVIRKASAQSRSEWRRQADSVQGDGAGAPGSPAEVLSQGVARAGKPDCLRQGGSLLSALAVAYEMATDQCVRR